MSAAPACTCGDPRPHVVTRRHTSDGRPVHYYSDGALCLGFDRVVIARRLDARAAGLLLGEVCLYEGAELRRAIKIARAAVRQDRTVPLVYFRRRMAGQTYRPIDRRGAVWAWIPARRVE